MHRIYLTIRRGFPLSRMTKNNLISSMKLYYNTSSPFLSNLKDLDPSYKTDLDYWGRFRRKNTPPYSPVNTVCSKKSNYNSELMNSIHKMVPLLISRHSDTGILLTLENAFS